jgi:Nucleotidyltransferase domain
MNATEVWLYGSTARGDELPDSDLDILVAGSDARMVDRVELPASGRLSVSHYQWAEIEQMASYGSLFLHHMRLEGKPLLESPDHRMRQLLECLGEYQRADRELASFHQVLQDVEASLGGDFSPHFELSVVATAARHAAILGCYVIGEPHFGRDSAFRLLLPQLGYGHGDVEEFVALYRFRRADDRQEPLATGGADEEVPEWVARVRCLIDQVARLADGS